MHALYVMHAVHAVHRITQERWLSRRCMHGVHLLVRA
jgi:hypothetical protein